MVFHDDRSSNAGATEGTRRQELRSLFLSTASAYWRRRRTGGAPVRECVRSRRNCAIPHTACPVDGAAGNRADRRAENDVARVVDVVVQARAAIVTGRSLSRSPSALG